MLTLTVGGELGTGDEFSARLAVAMQAAQINAAGLAAAVGVSQSAVSQWLSATSKSIKVEHLFVVADVLGVEPRWLGLGDGPMRRELPADLSDLSPEQIAALRRLLGR